MSRSLKFMCKFLGLFLVFYYSNVAFISLSSPGGFHIPYLETQLNYIDSIRNFYISTASFILVNLGFRVSTSSMSLSVADHSGFRLVYSCLGYGIISCFTAFTLAIPKPFKSRHLFLLVGVALIVLLNIFRLVFISIYYKAEFRLFTLDHHTLYNSLTYGVLLLFSFLWLKTLKYEQS
jgi:exosortase/archaeosortase family protein